MTTTPLLLLLRFQECRSWNRRREFCALCSHYRSHAFYPKMGVFQQYYKVSP